MGRAANRRHMHLGAAAPAPGEVEIGGLADHHTLGLHRVHHRAQRHPLQHFLQRGRAHRNAPAQRAAIHRGRGMHHRRQRALHVRRAPAHDGLIHNGRGKWVMPPSHALGHAHRINVRIQQQRLARRGPLDHTDHAAVLVHHHPVKAQAAHLIHHPLRHRGLLPAEAGPLDQRLGKLDHLLTVHIDLH